MPKKYDLEFQPVQRRRKDQVTRFLLGFGAILLLLVVASAIALQRDGLIDTIFSPTTTTQPEEPDADIWEHEGSAVFLLAGHDSARQNLYFVMLLQLELETRTLEIEPLNPRDNALVQGLRQGGVRGLQNAVEAAAETQIDRYAAAADNAFIRAVNAMGSVTAQLDEGIRFRSQDFSLTLAQGTQRLQGDMLLRYFRYLGLNENTLAQQAELMRTVLETYLVPRNAETEAVAEARFRTLVGLLDTDLIVADFFANRDVLLDLLAEPEEIVIEVKG